MRKRIYISGPITKGNRSVSFFQAAEAQRRLMENGYAVLNPMLSIMHPDGNNIPYEDWIESDLAYVAVSDFVLRLPGESKGADIETKFAREHGIEVVSSEFFECLRGLYTHDTECERSGRKAMH
jgi:hypothetical protein